MTVQWINTGGTETKNIKNSLDFLEGGCIKSPKTILDGRDATLRVRDK